MYTLFFYSSDPVSLFRFLFFPAPFVNSLPVVWLFLHFINRLLSLPPMSKHSSLFPGELLL